MSNTGRTKKLASFNCDQKMWEEFIARCNSKGITATATLIRFIELYLDGSLDDLDAIAGNQNKRLDSVEQKIEEITAQMTKFTEAIIKIQNYLNNQQQQKRRKPYNNNSKSQTSSRLQPLTEEGLASRFEVSQEIVRKNRIDLPSTLFIAWCKEKDRAGIGWEFKQDTGLYHPLI